MKNKKFFDTLSQIYPYVSKFLDDTWKSLRWVTASVALLKLFAATGNKVALVAGLVAGTAYVALLFSVFMSWLCKSPTEKLLNDPGWVPWVMACLFATVSLALAVLIWVLATIIMLEVPFTG